MSPPDDKPLSVIAGGFTRAVGAAAGAAGSLGRMVGSSLRLPGMKGARRHHPVQPGARPGLEDISGRDRPPEPGTVRIHCCDYSMERVEERQFEDVAALLAEPRPEWVKARWINVDGLHPYVIDRFCEALGFHTLAAEDVVHVPQRPKAESYDKHLFIIARMLRLTDGKLNDEQVSFFLQPGLLVTFQQRSGDVWDPIRQRIRSRQSRIRTHGVGYLTYALLDAIVDHAFPLLERYGEVLEALEAEVLENPTPPLLQRIHRVKRELTILRRVMWPTREVLSRLQEDEDDLFSDSTKTYLRDAYQHAVQILDLIETFRDMAGGLTDLYMSAVSNRMNEVMKVLTVIATIFIPITFLAGVYGMNFEHIPELKWKWAYPAFWGGCAAITAGLLIMFRRRGWLGGRD